MNLFMPLRYLALAFSVLLCSAASVSARIERTIERTFTVQPGGTLNVSTSGGNIEVKPGTGREVRVVAHQTFRRADTEAEADALAKELDLTIEQKANDVYASFRSSQQRIAFIRGGSQVTVSFTVTVPAQFNVDLRTSGGNITVGDLAGEVQVQTSGGNLRLGRIEGTVNGRTSGGNIEVQEARQKVDVRTSGGNIKIGQVSGEVAAHTSGGSISIEQASGAVDAHTSGGNITVAIVGRINRDMTLRTSGGSITARVSPEAAFHLDARTSGGRVRADGMTIQIQGSDPNRGRLSGAVNGGGPTVTLRSSGGNVSVQPL
jgi:hypothetical protein